MYYLVLATDAPDTAAKREEIGPIHRAHLRHPGNHRVKVHLGGPTLTMQHEQTNGTLLIVEADEMDAVSEFMADDPYAQAGVFQSVEIRPWAWTLGQPVPLTEATH
ncbi:MAG: YciI family protein [Betaproteobacteria bacterium]|nr:YciI family protein [Betaproteobacteria bacterium]